MTRCWLRPRWFALVASGLPGPVAWRLLRSRRAARLSNYFRRRRADLSFRHWRDCGAADLAAAARWQAHLDDLSAEDPYGRQRGPDL